MTTRSPLHNHTRQRERDEDVTLVGEVMHETERAFKFHDGVRDVWLPKSVCKWDVDAKCMHVPRWLAMDKELI